MLTRDSWVLTLTILAAVCGVVLAQFDVLPSGWQQYRGALTIFSSIVGVIASILRSSPLASTTTSGKDSRLVLGGLLKLTDKG